MTFTMRLQVLAVTLLLSDGFAPKCVPVPNRSTRLFSDWNDDSMNPNKWEGSDSDFEDNTPDWEQTLRAKEDGTYWSAFDEDERDSEADSGKKEVSEEDARTEAWLEKLAARSAEEVAFNMKEADRADKARQMEEWGFDAKTISNTLGVATSTEQVETMKEIQDLRQKVYGNDWDDVDFKAVDSHTMVECDEDTGEPVRQQMVYVDEHTCIGCTNCAMIAQSTFFMEDEYGRARVYQQWGDDDETIAVAIETCPVDCIHYVPYDELVKLEKERSGQVINFKGRLVGNDVLAHRVGGAVRFSERQEISGDTSARCNNCPSRGCRNCPMFGVGKNPEYERREKLRLEKKLKRQLEQERRDAQKSVDL